MKEVYVRRHAQKSLDGMLAPEGVEAAQVLARRMPTFVKVIASDVPRAQHTAKLLTGADPIIDGRAGYTEIDPESVDAIEALGREYNLPFFGAASKYENSAIGEGMEAKADELNALIDEILESIDRDQKALIVSHDITIVPAMIKRGVLVQTINPLEGYVLRDDGSIDTLRS